MDTEFWLEKWESREIGFHRDAVNQQLERHWPSLGIGAERAVLVPLCGKSLDLVYLRRLGHPMVGVELSPLAVREFFAEQGLQPESRDLGDGLRAFEAEGVCLIQGDFFALRREDLPEIGAVYDRAALIAMPPETQPRYAAQLVALLPEEAPMLLITLEYDNDEMQGPPFSTPADQ
ncbi:thiopurine S-methyltransferase, partial [Methylomagnum sp.]